MVRDIIRRCMFRAYLGAPRFHLTLWDTHRITSSGKAVLGYELYRSGGKGKPRILMFSGEDFGCPGHVAIDSDKCVKILMAFLCLRPGDTDTEHFDKYTDVQMEFAKNHAYHLSQYLNNRFGFWLGA
jgi:hypothetical protein